MTVIVGIDPGTAGGIAALNGSNEILLLADLPVFAVSRVGVKQTRAELDAAQLASLLADLGPIRHAYIERVAAMPKQGITSTFRFGYAAGVVFGVVTALGIPVTMIAPRAWQKLHGVGPQPEAARQRAVQLYPDAADRLARKRDHNRADALLIAAAGGRLLQP